jgi:hypothetical protein
MSQPFPQEIMDICESFAKFHGRNWRSQMIKLWNDPFYTLSNIQRVRNVAGPQGIYKIKFPKT